MKFGVFLLTVCCLFFLSLASKDLINSPLPVLLWSGQNYFHKKNNQFLDIVKEDDISSSLKSILGVSSQNNNDLKNHFEPFHLKSPEVAVLFLKSQLATDDLSAGHFSNLRKAVMETATSSLVIPYLMSQKTNPFVDIFNQVAPELKNSKILAATPKHVENLFPGAHHVDHEQLLNVLNEPSELFSNKITDLIIVTLEGESEVDDSFIAQIEEAIHKHTHGNYVALFSALSSEIRPVTRTLSYLLHDEIGNKKRILRDLLVNDDTYSTYFPGVVWDAILVVIVLLIIAFLGVCCTAAQQTPLRYETPKRNRALAE